MPFKLPIARHHYDVTLLADAVLMQVEELQKKREETARALRAVSAKSQELEARMHHLSASASSSEQELRSEAAEVYGLPTTCCSPHFETEPEQCSGHPCALRMAAATSAWLQCSVRRHHVESPPSGDI